MKTVTINATVIASIVLLVGFTAYSGQTEAPAVTKAVDQGFTSPGKGNAGLTMTHSLSATPAVGQPLALELVFAATHNDTMELQINADDALAAGPRVSRRVSGGESVVVDLVPQAEGRYYVNVIARVGSGDGARARAFSVPIQVGKGSYKSSAKKATVSPNGERLIRMQAQEKASD